MRLVLRYSLPSPLCDIFLLKQKIEDEKYNLKIKTFIPFFQIVGFQFDTVFI